jgi:thiol-disulfide isomerase/thioredoxin
MSSRLVLSIALVVALAASRAGAQGLEWTTDLASAQRTAAQTNRLVLVHFGGPWCKPCRDMEEQVFAKAGLNYAVMPNFVPVKIDVQYGEQNELARQLGVNGFPSDIIMTPQGTVVDRSTGFKAAPEYLSMLNQAAQKARATQPAANVAGVPPMPAQAALPPHAGAPLTPPVQPALAPGANAAGLPPLPAGAASPLTAMRTTPAPTPPVAQPLAPPAVAPAGIAPVGIAPAAVAPPLPASGPVAPRTVLPPTTTPAIVPSTPPLGAPQTAPPSVSQSPSTGPAGPAGTGTASAPRAAGQPALPPGSPPLALDGYCPVTLTEKMIWKRGDVRFGAIHRGRTYLFSTATEQAKFLARPDGFSPIMSGNDPVAWLEQGKPVPGKREHGIMFNNKMILFASEASKEKFRGDQNRYDFEIKQAMQAADGGTLRR